MSAFFINAKERSMESEEKLEKLETQKWIHLRAARLRSDWEGNA
jgi:hypothetical protein